MMVKRIEVGLMGVNCYLVGCERTREALIIDPGEDAEWIMEDIKAGEWNMRYIINTHGHFDHIGANLMIKEATGASILIHTDDREMLIKPELNQSANFGLGHFSVIAGPADRTLTDGELVEAGETVRLRVIHTPGHTPGSISLYQSGHLFTGDTLFAYSIGRTDFAGGSYEQIMESIDKLMLYPDGTQVYPGHNVLATLGEIRVQNPLIR